MKKFEYYSFYAETQDELDKELDKLGNDGWEAYAIVQSKDCRKLLAIVYLKREKA